MKRDSEARILIVKHVKRIRQPYGNYVVIGHFGDLPVLFTKVILPTIVRDELAAASPVVRRWSSILRLIQVKRTSDL